MDVLLVGAGSVGLVYGRHLALGGASVAYLVKPEHEAEARRGFTLYPLVSRDRRDPVRFEGFDVYTSVGEAKRRRWDQIWLAVPASAVSDDFFQSLSPLFRDAIVVALPPGIEASAIARRHVAADRLVAGLIGLISYWAPLPGENVKEPGIAYMFPPFTPSAFGGENPKAARAVVEALVRGECPARRDDDIDAKQAMGSSVLMPLVASLKLAGWSFSRLARTGGLSRAFAAAREGMAIAAAYHDSEPPPFRILLQPWSTRLAWAVAERALPLDLELYMKVHFTKVGEQTHKLLSTYVKEGKARGIAVGEVERLAEALRRTPTRPFRMPRATVTMHSGSVE